MVSKKEKEKMLVFIIGGIEESYMYDIKEADNSHILVAQKPDLFENPAHIEVLLHNEKTKLKDYERRISKNSIDGVFTADVFYKNEKDFMVRLGGKASFKGDYRSLKRYSKDELDKMIHLRGLEKSALESQMGNPFLTYFQPETARLDEGLRGYQMKDVHFDYSHIEEGDHGYGFARPSTSKDYKIAEEIPGMKVDGGPVTFKRIGTRQKKKAAIKSAYDI